MTLSSQALSKYVDDGLILIDESKSAYRFGTHPSFLSMMASTFSVMIMRWALCLPLFAMTLGSLIFLDSARIR